MERLKQSHREQSHREELRKGDVAGVSDNVKHVQPNHEVAVSSRRLKPCCRREEQWCQE